MSEIFYLRAELTAKSPLIIGSGTDDNTDSDILVGSDGKPYIPATTLAGVFRHYVGDINNEGSLFGFSTSGDDYTNNKSKIVFYDAQLINEAVISSRDGVRLDKNKIAENAGKFDYEIINSGSRFEFRMEVHSETGYTEIIDDIITGLNSSQLRIGGKSNRGFGEISIDNIKCKKIDIKSNPDEYINFIWDSVTDDYIVKSEAKNKYISTEIDFSVASFLFIRNYATLAVDENNNNKSVDAEQLLNSDNKPVIPGTSWAGVFRHHIDKILDKLEYENKDKFISDLFGNVIESENMTIPSKIIFSESVIENSHQMNRTRNAIDRFTGGAGDKKLFTTRPTYGGEGTLKIMIKKDSSLDLNFAKSLINTCIKDINEGILTVGGETSTGGGILSIANGGVVEWTE